MRNRKTSRRTMPQQERKKEGSATIDAKSYLWEFVRTQRRKGGRCRVPGSGTYTLRCLGKDSLWTTGNLRGNWIRRQEENMNGKRVVCIVGRFFFMSHVVFCPIGINSHKQQLQRRTALTFKFSTTYTTVNAGGKTCNPATNYGEFPFNFFM